MQLFAFRINWRHKSQRADEEDYWTASKLFEFVSLLVVILAMSMFTIQELEVAPIPHVRTAHRPSD